MWHMGTGVSGGIGSAEGTGVLSDLERVFETKQFYNSLPKNVYRK